MSEALKVENVQQIKNLPLLLRDSDYKLTQFKQSQIDAFEERIHTKDSKGKSVLFTQCLVRRKEIRLTPEEAVRQLYIIMWERNIPSLKTRTFSICQSLKFQQKSSQKYLRRLKKQKLCDINPNLFWTLPNAPLKSPLSRTNLSPKNIFRMNV